MPIQNILFCTISKQDNVLSRMNILIPQHMFLRLVFSFTVDDEKLLVLNFFTVAKSLNSRIEQNMTI
jgi:hypothetical protein